MEETHLTNNTHRRGFASMTVEKKRTIASQGGKAAHAQGRAHKWNSTEAAAAGAIGGRKSRKTSPHASAIRQRLAAGESVTQIVQALGVATATVYRMKRQMEEVS